MAHSLQNALHPQGPGHRHNESKQRREPHQLPQKAPPPQKAAQKPAPAPRAGKSKAPAGSGVVLPTPAARTSAASAAPTKTSDSKGCEAVKPSSKAVKAKGNYANKFAAKSLTPKLSVSDIENMAYGGM